MNASITKSILTLASVATLGLALLPAAASAGEVNNRDRSQQARIDQGIASGQLTHREYNRDENRLNRVENQRNRDLAANNGHLTRGEYVHLNRELNRNSRDIYYTKHNLAHQPGAPTR